MPKILTVDPERCTGCRICEMVCSVNKEGACNPTHSRIHTIKWEMEGFYAPMFCRHCEDPLCAAVCPVNAIDFHDSYGRTSVNDEQCIGCRACVTACPFGGVGYNHEQQKTMRCDLCDGDPLCVQFCETKALQFVDSETIHINKQRAAAEKLYHSSTN